MFWQCFRITTQILWCQPKTYFFLESKWNSSDGTLLNSLHQVSGVTSDLVSKSLGLNHTDIIDDSLVDMEIIGQPSQKHDQLDNWTKRRQAQKTLMPSESDPTNKIKINDLLSVVLLNECSGSSLNSLGSYSSLHNSSRGQRDFTVANSSKCAMSLTILSIQYEVY